MKTSLEGKIMLTHLEGVSLTKYKCTSGWWTIGVGATKSEIPNLPNWPMDKSITIPEAFELLDKSLVKYENAINNALKVPVTQYQFDALVSWIYNVGVGWANKAYVIQLLNSGCNGDTKYEREQLYNALMRYSKPKVIIGRRQKEAKLLTTGEYSGNGQAALITVSPSGQPKYNKTINVRDYLNENDLQMY